MGCVGVPVSRQLEAQVQIESRKNTTCLHHLHDSETQAPSRRSFRIIIIVDSKSELKPGSPDSKQESKDPGCALQEERAPFSDMSRIKSQESPPIKIYEAESKRDSYLRHRSCFVNRGVVFGKLGDLWSNEI